MTGMHTHNDRTKHPFRGSKAFIISGLLTFASATVTFSSAKVALFYFTKSKSQTKRSDFYAFLTIVDALPALVHARRTGKSAGGSLLMSHFAV